MKIQPIRTEADYDKALAAVERLWGAEPSTPSGDRLDVLLVLVEDYEEKHHPIGPPDPIEAIKFRMEQMNFTRKDLGADDRFARSRDGGHQRSSSPSRSP